MKAKNIFQDYDYSTPALVVSCWENSYSGLGIVRSLGRVGVPVYCLSTSKDSPALVSRYLREGFLEVLGAGTTDEEFISILKKIAERIGQRSVLITTVDYFAILAARTYDVLEEFFLEPRVSPSLVQGLYDKQEMHQLANDCGLVTVPTVFPDCREAVERFAEKAAFPVVVKGIDGTELERRASKRMIIVGSPAELFEAYDKLEDQESPNLIFQEYIHGSGSQDWMFNGYFDDQSNCLASFTGEKVRQAPILTGFASYGVCERNEVVELASIKFLQTLGYVGAVDIDYRFDGKDGLYKIVDVNPRVGATFRLFVGESGLDVVRAMYLDMTGQKVPKDIQVEGRKWMVEDRDLTSAFSMYRKNALTLRDWVRSLKGVSEFAWFATDDLLPFLSRCWYHIVTKLSIARSFVSKADQS